MRVIASASVGSALMLGIMGVVTRAQDTPAELPGPIAKQDPQTGVRRLLREGSRFDNAIGTFKVMGNRLTFSTSDGKHRFIALENLVLERVARVIEDSQQNIEWSVDCDVTEYQGSNYVLITHARRKHRLNERAPALESASPDSRKSVP